MMSFFAPLLFNPLVSFVPIGCLANFTFYSTLLVMGIAVLLLEVSVIVFNARIGRKKQTLGWVLVVLYLIFPSANTIIFQTFNCHSLGELGSYLKADYQLDCETEAHDIAVIFAGVMSICGSLGVLLLFFVLMYRDRKAQHLHFFCGSYKEEYYYWECIEIMKKLILVGFNVTFKPGSIVQLTAAILVTLIYTAALLRCQPYIENSTIAEGSSLLLVVVFLGSLLIKISGASSSSIYEEGYTVEFVAWLIFSINMIVFGHTSVCALLDVWAAYGEYTGSDGSADTALPTSPADRLSHKAKGHEQPALPAKKKIVI
jgi:hypothetical protein